VKTLAVAEGARLRAGDYRAIFSENEIEITVLAVGHRKEIYR
jgi:mRNA-degrading endonuclease RelE of RelBE toxin-antitoxin system